MKTVNPCFFLELLEPLVGLADVDEEVESYRTMNPNLAEEVMQVIDNILKPHFNSLSNIKQEKCKLALSYYLTTSKIDFEKVFDSYLLPFDPPSEPKLFFVWLWKVLFGGEDYIIQNPDDFIEHEDITAPFQIG